MIRFLLFLIRKKQSYGCMIIGFLGSIGTDGLGSVVRVPGIFAKMHLHGLSCRFGSFTPEGSALKQRGLKVWLGGN